MEKISVEKINEIAEKVETIFEEFGVAFTSWQLYIELTKENFLYVLEDYRHQKRLAPVIRFDDTRDPNKWTILVQYIPDLR
jgi:hypothetical protein